MEEDFSNYNGEGTYLRRLQCRLLELLKNIDVICRRHDIPYWIDFGTLLGAVRHKGFIPWDDDIDISVLESDYDRLRKVLIAALPPTMAFQDSTTDSYVFCPYGRVRDKKSYCYYSKFVKQKEQGCWIDIFKYYDIPSAKSKKIVDYFYRRAYREIHHYGDVTYNSKIKITLNKVIAYLIYPISALAVDFLGVFARLIKSNLYGRYSTTDHTYKKEHIFPLVEIEYEGHLFYAPKDYDAHLKRIYGNYMDIPPVEKREQLLDVEKIEFYE